MKIYCKIICISLFIFLMTPSLSAQISVKINDQISFGKKIPPGNYSGITRLKDDSYAVVSDKSELDGFFIFRIYIDSINGNIVNVENEGFVASAVSNRDAEGIAYIPERKTVLIVGERDGRIMEYDSVGTFTGRELLLEKESKTYGYESLTYNENTGLLWTCTENIYSDAYAILANDTMVVVRLKAFNTDLYPVSTYLYRLDKPLSDNIGKYYAHGVSELLALDDGSLIVLEREFRVPKSMIGAYVLCKLYLVDPQNTNLTENKELFYGTELHKTLLCKWTTKLSLFNHSLANYEGMCLGPKLSDGSQTIIMISDSQNRSGGILRDWFRTIIIK